MANVLEYFVEEGNFFSGDPWFNLQWDLDEILSEISYNRKSEDIHWIKVRQRWLKMKYGKMINRHLCKKGDFEEDSGYIPDFKEGLPGAMVQLMEAYFGLQEIFGYHPEEIISIEIEESAKDILNEHLLWLDGTQKDYELLVEELK